MRITRIPVKPHTAGIYLPTYRPNRHSRLRENIKEEYSEGYGSESLGKMALMGALSLYLNFINLFTMLLQLFGQRE